MKRRAQPWLGTLVEITIGDADLADTELNANFTRAFSAIADVHRLMSFHDPASDVSRINCAVVDEWIEIDARTLAVIDAAQAVNVASGGIFDIACAAVLVAWAYLPCPRGSMADALSSASALIVDAESSRVKKTRAVWIDLGGIAKGYAVDMAIAALRECGVGSACVNAGGDLRVLGAIAYPVVVRCPDAPTAGGLQLMLQDEALATSGTYFSRKHIDDRAVSALIDARDGCAITANFSASVRAASCMLADALTKVVMASADPAHPALARFGATATII